MRIALFGRTGQVATEVRRRAPDGVEVRAIGRDEADFTDPDAVRRAARQVEADAVVNAAAFTAVDQAEAEEPVASLVNGASAGALAEVCAERDLPLLHISTDYVFDGGGARPWRPGDPTHPAGAYGRSKLMGERLVLASGARAAVLRVSWVFSAHGANFVKTMLRLGRERDRLTVVSDQIGGPTPAAAIADALMAMAARMIDGAPGGVYHFAGTPDTSWSDFAREIMRQAGLDAEIADIPSAEYPTPARRPMNSRLDCADLERDFGIKRPDWRDGLRDVLEELGAR